MTDAERLLEAVEKKAEPRLRAIRKRIENGTATFADTAEYSRILSELIGRELSAEVLGLTDREGTAEALLRESYNDTNEVCAQVQTALDEKKGLHLASQKAPFPAERVAQFAHSLVDPTVPDEKIQRRAKSGTENISMSFHDDFIEQNAEFRERAGLKCYVTRTSSGSCCPWCTAVAGKYLMSEQPEGLFRRHDNCDCVIVYDGQVLRGQKGENGRRNKKWVEEPEGIKDIVKSFKNKLTGKQNNGKIDTVGTSIGVKVSKPMSIDDALKGANPNFSTDRNYRINCQRCVQAYELRRRGYNVEALPYPKGRSKIVWGNECFIDSKVVLSGKANTLFEMKKYQVDILDELSNAPDGSRHIIYAQWKRGGAHVFIAEKENGVIRFVDPQSAKVDCSSHFDKAVDGRFGIFRLDDKDITDNANILKKTVKRS